MDANTKSVLEKLRRDFEDGEDLKFLVSRISVYFKTDPGWTDFVPCMLIITNFQLTFSFADESISTINVPITSIDSCSRKSKSRKLNLYCKDFRSLILQFQSTPELDMVYKHIGKYIKFKDPSVLAFAFWYTPIAADPGWTMFSPLKEYERMGLNAPNSLWRISECNTNYTVCDSYPELLCVPKDFTDQNIRAVAKFRSRNRLPVLTWLDNRNTTDYTSPDRDTRRYSSITRCSMPLVGVSGSRNYQDESLVTMFLMSNPRQQSVSIVDCRPRAVGVGSLANGGGYEFGAGYENCKVSFMSVENIHVMRESFAQLFALLQDSKKGTSSWYSKLESASWFRHLRLIMQASMRVVEIVEREHGSALVHCTDGWDRTSQITSLAQLCLDPHYRSIEGFLLLIEKDWLWFGHKFQERTFGSERSPVFLQFLDCVHQIMHQYPCSFEFNQHLLVFLVDSLYNCRFGTFLHDTPKERVENKTMQKTLSAWSYILNNKRQFLNPFYKHRNETLYPAYSEKKIVFWTEYYMRWTSNPFETVEDIAMKQLEQAEAKLLQLQATLNSAQAELLKQVIDEFPYLCDSKLRQPSLNASGDGFKRPAKPFGTLGKGTGKNTLGKSGGLNADVFLSSHRDSDAQDTRADLFASGDVPEELPEMDPAVEFQVMDRRERQRNRLESTEFCEWEQNRKLNVNATILQISSKNKAAMQMFKDIDETLDDSEDAEPNFMYDDDTTNDDDEPTPSPETPTPLHQRVLNRENKKAAARRSGLLLANSAMYFQPTPEESNDVEHDLAPSAVKQISVAVPPKVMPKVPVPPPKKQHTPVKSFTPPKVAPPKAPGTHKSLQPNTALIVPAQNQAPSPQAHSPPQQNGALSPRNGQSPPPPPRDTKPTLSPRPGLKTSPSLPHLPSMNGVSKSTENGALSPRGNDLGPGAVKLSVKK